MSKEAKMDALVSFSNDSIDDFCKRFKDVVVEDGIVKDAEYIEVKEKNKQIVCKIKR